MTALRVERDVQKGEEGGRERESRNKEQGTRNKEQGTRNKLQGASRKLQVASRKLQVDTEQGTRRRANRAGVPCDSRLATCYLLLVPLFPVPVLLRALLPRAWLGDWRSGQPVGDLVGRARWEIDGRQRMERRAEVDLTAAVDDRAAPTTWAPAARATSDRLARRAPVVTTSSTTSTRSCGSRAKPRRSVSAPSCRSANKARTPRPRATSWPMIKPPRAGDSTTSASRSRTASASARPSASACAGYCSTRAHCM